MKLYQIFSLWMALTMVLTACPTRKVDRRPHDGPVSEQEPVPMPTVEANSVHFQQAPAAKAQNSLKDPKADVYRTVIAPLADYVMNPSYVENPQYSGTLRMRSMLNTYNQALLKLIDAKSEVVTRHRLLDRYEKILLAGCDEQMADLQGCVNIKFFRVDHLTSKIVQRIAATKADVKQYYKLLALAYELQNRTKDKELEFMYFKRAREYSRYFNELPEADREKPLIRRHGIIFETLLRDFAADPKNPEFRKFVFEFEPWTYSRLKQNTFRYGTQRLFQLVAENYMYEPNGRLNSDLVKSLAVSQGEADALGASFTQIVKELNSGEYAHVLKSLGVEYGSILNGSIQDEYFFVTDRLYRGHLSVDEAVQIWLGSKRNSTRLLDIIALYLRVQIVKKIIETNEFMRDIYADPQYDSTTMIRTVLEKSKDISDRWLDMLERVELLKRLVNSQLKTFGHDSEDLKRTNKMFDSIRRNIKYMAVYPNMFLMSYFLARNKAKFKVYSWYGEFDIDHTSLINGFMEGGMAPWFRFGNDELPLTKIEMMYAYYFALNNGSFETFNKIKESNGEPAVDRVRFLKEIVKEYVGSENLTMREALEKQRTLFSSNGYSQFLEYCARDRAGDRSFTTEMDFAKIGAYTYFGGGMRSHWSPMAEAPYVFYETALPTLTKINTDVRLKLTVVRTMIDILKDDLGKRGLSDQDTKRWTEQIESIVNETEKFRRDYVNDTVTRHREIGDCVERARDIEFERQSSLYKEEVAHLKSVYRDLLGLQSMSGPQLAAKELELSRKYGFTADASAPKDAAAPDVFKYDVITQKYYRFSKYDLFQRMMKRISKMKPATFFRVPADMALSVEFYRNKDGNPLNILDSKGSPISEKEFVASGMRYLNGFGNNSYINWNETGKNDFNDKKILALSELFQITYGVREFAEQIKPKDVVNEVMNMVELAAIKPGEEEILRLMGRDRKVEIEDLRKFMIDIKSGEELPVLENALKHMTKSDAQLNEAKQFFLAMKHSGYFLFAPSKEVVELMRNQYRPLVDGVRLRSKDLLAEAAASAAKLVPEQISFPYELSADGLVYYRAGVGPDGKVQLLSNRSVKDMQASERDFDRETENYFKGGK